MTAAFAHPASKVHAQQVCSTELEYPHQVTLHSPSCLESAEPHPRSIIFSIYHTFRNIRVHDHLTTPDEGRLRQREPHSRPSSLPDCHTAESRRTGGIGVDTN